MTARDLMQAVAPLKSSLSKVMVLAVAGLGLVLPSAIAKDAPLTAIELYDGAKGPAYVQLGDVLINGKALVRDCSPMQSAPMDKSAYSKLDKFLLAAGGVLDRGADGVLHYQVAGGRQMCVVPEGVKFEHNASFSAAQMADGIQFRGTPLAAASDGAAGSQPIEKGVKLVFVSAPDVELAEYLLAQRAGNIAGWKNYIGRYPAAAHTAEAQTVLAGLYDDAGEMALGAYRKSSSSATVSYADLKEAKAQLDLAAALRPKLDATVKLGDEIRTSLARITDKGRAELDAYNIALAGRAPGYGHLQAAKALAEAVAQVDSAFEPGSKLLADVVKAANAIESAMKSAEAAVQAQQLDDALQSVLPYRGFAAEEARIAQVIEANYKFHVDAAKQAETGQEWETAIKEYQKAQAAKDTAEVRDALTEAGKKLVIAQDQAAAKAALDKSQTFEAAKDMINAYEVLANLTEAQQVTVADDLKRLTPLYVLAASDKAKAIVKTYPTIQGIGDERQIEEAYRLLQAAYGLSDDGPAKSSYQTRMENLGDELSAWFLDRAKHYLEKPAGSFTEVGWAYLKEAESYKAANLEQVRDQTKLAEPAQAMHSKLSIRVHFVDQTSLRESTGFMHQLEDAIITGLQAPAYHTTPIRYGETTNGVEPDFQLEGNVLEHEIVETPKSVSKESKYRTGTHQEQNEAWVKANREYEDARDQVQTDQSQLTVAETNKNKKAILEINQKMSDDRKAVSVAETKRDAVPQFVTKDDIRPYQYTLKTIDIKNRIKLQFSVGRAQSGQMGAAVVVEKEEPKQYELVEDVKADDTEGVKLMETTPNTREMQTALENTVRDALIDAVRTKVLDLPREIFEEAKTREKEENLEDAGEAYLRYLCVTPAEKTTERIHAENYLREQFNFSTFPSVAP
jgi:hypothetical protein